MRVRCTRFISGRKTVRSLRAGSKRKKSVQDVSQNTVFVKMARSVFGKNRDKPIKHNVRVSNRFFIKMFYILKLSSRVQVFHAFHAILFQIQFFLMPLFAFLRANIECRLDTVYLCNTPYIWGINPCCLNQS